MSSTLRSASDPILFLGKRFYTNKDAWKERFGRIFRLPLEWSKSGEDVLLWLLDYHSRESVAASDCRLAVWSCPVFGFGMLAMLFRVVRFRPKTVVASGDCYVGLLGWLLARLLGARFVFDIYDKYDEFAGYVRPFGLDLFGFLRRHADRRFYPSRLLAKRYSDESGGAGDEIVENGVDGDAFHPMSMAECRARLGLDPVACLIGYFGSLDPDRGISDLVAAVELLRQQGKDLRVLVGGREFPGAPLDKGWIVFKGMIPHADVPFYLNASDLLVVPYRASPYLDMAASCKIAEYLMCSRPIVSTRTPNFAGNFPAQAAELGDGLCRPGDAVDLARAIAYQLRHKVVVSQPMDMTWPAIAAHALACMHSEARQAIPNR